MAVGVVQSCGPAAVAAVAAAVVAVVTVVTRAAVDTSTRDWHEFYSCIAHIKNFLVRGCSDSLY